MSEPAKSPSVESMEAGARERFWAKVEMADCCWLWRGTRQDDGYGSFAYKGRTLRAHRVAWMLTGGPILAGLHVLHRCDTPLCVRPEHLFLGTNTENVADRNAKRRQAAGDRNGMRLHPDRVLRGERNGQVKLTEDQVKQILRLRAQGSTLQRLADTFGVSPTSIWRIVRGDRWRHVGVAAVKGKGKGKYG